jgi:adenine phosphoribosyltransferase
MRQIIEKVNAQVAAEAAILTEGEKSRWENVLALGHLPLFTD